LKLIYDAVKNSMVNTNNPSPSYLRIDSPFQSEYKQGQPRYMQVVARTGQCQSRRRTDENMGGGWHRNDEKGYLGWYSINNLGRYSIKYLQFKRARGGRSYSFRIRIERAIASTLVVEIV
jgi:hypothetical protein